VTDILHLVEKIQLASEKRIMLGKSDEKILADYEARSRFYVALADNNLSNSDVALQSFSTGDESLFKHLEENGINLLRKDLERFPINFTNAEPPSVAAMLARSFARVSRFSQSEMPHAKFILATDLTYRPHASVQEWASQMMKLLGLIEIFHAHFLLD
jgi:hypothetical protein